MKWRHVPILTSWVLKLGLGLIFVVAGFGKLDNPSKFADEIANYQLFPEMAPYLAATLPMVELVVGFVLILSLRRSQWLHAAAACAALLMVMFTIGTSQVVARDINIECGCFGGDSGPVDNVTVVRDVVLFVAAVLLLVLALTTTRPGEGGANTRRRTAVG